MTDNKDGKVKGTVKLGRIGDRPYWVLVFSIFIRAVHQVGAAVFLASFLLEGVIAVPRVYLVIAALSGMVLLGTETLRHRQLFREVSGLSTLFKLVVLGMAYHGGLPATIAVLFAYVLASIFSHAPKFIRHRLIF